jgi:roadblock/LC7 domain-containing protein
VDIEAYADAYCYNSSNGTIMITAASGTAPYSYSWTGPNGFTSIVEDHDLELAAGDYTVVVTDANGCTVSMDQTVNAPPVIDITVNSTTNEPCYGGSNGAISITASGGSSNFSYSWTGPNGFASSNEDLTNLIAGTYVVTVVDGNGCSKISSDIIITEPPAHTATVAATSLITLPH